MNKQPVQFLVGIGGWEHECFDQCLYGTGTEYSAIKLRYYSRFFDTVEIRQTFWDDELTENDAQQWMEAVRENRRFRFNVKLHKSFVHGKEIKPERATRVRALWQELQKNERLGIVLVQLPYSFTNTSANRFHLEKLSEVFRGFPLHVEFRNESWNDVNFLKNFLRENQLQVVNADLPRTKQLMPFVTEVIGDTAYVRLHGRNEKGWLINDLDTRYDYLYNAKEMRELSRRIEIISQKCDRVMITFNNTTRGKAVANAFQMISALKGGKQILVPEAAAKAFPIVMQDLHAVVEDGLFVQADLYRRVG